MKQFSLMLVPDVGQVKSFRVSSQTLWVLLLIGVGVLAFGGWGVHSIYQKSSLLNALEVSNNRLKNVRHRQHEAYDKMQQKLNAEQQKMAVYARQLGQMQASVLRLDSLGQRLVEVSKLKENEFNFGLEPALGGPRGAEADFSVLNLDHQMQSAQQKLTHLDAQLAAVDVILQDQRDEKRARPHAWPSEGGWLSSKYGMRIDPFTGLKARHKGVDIANRLGSPVLSSSRGVVIFAGKMSAYGYMVEVEHGYGYRTRYGHMSNIAVKAGDEVADSQLLGRVGSTGRSTGPHLHFEVLRYNQRINPAGFLPRG
ncbi:MAG: peptidoglycan DD-metalloendopeptidase family protein [Mariprofundaceae bacterium]